MKIKQTLLSIVLCLSIYLAICPLAVAGEEARYATGLILEDELAFLISDSAVSQSTPDSSILSSTSIPQSCDLSTSVYFPPIQDQGNVGSCTAFAMGYYQFTYEKNRLNAVSSTLSSTWASPIWIYNMVNSTPIANGNGGGGSSISNIEHLLQYQGAVSWQDMPYQSSNYDKVYTIEDDEGPDALRNALKTRLSSLTTKTISSYTSSNSNYAPKITTPDDSDLNEIKDLLANQGKVLTITTNDPNVYDFKTATNGDKVWYRSITTDASSGYHAMVVVGYNDTISCDINGNGSIEDAEKGAFKVANSWGSNWGNDGYIWVMYDALNRSTAVSGTWENNLSGVRHPMFSPSSAYYNFFHVMSVENKNVQLTAEIYFCTSNLRKTDITLKKYYYYGTSVIINDKDTIHTGTVGLPISADGVLAIADFSEFFDYTVLHDTNLSYFLGFDISMENADSTDEIWWFDAALTDSLGNFLTGDFESYYPNGTSYGYSKRFGYPIGDINYSGRADSSDALIIIQYLNGQKGLSSIQQYLADYNSDGVIDNADANAILNASVNNSTIPEERAQAQAILDSLVS